METVTAILVDDEQDALAILEEKINTILEYREYHSDIIKP